MAEKVAYRGGVPALASRGPDAAFVERLRDRFERGCAGSSDCFDDRQKTGRELIGGGDLDLPAGHSRRSDVRRVAQLGAAALLRSQRRLGALRDQPPLSPPAPRRGAMNGSASRPNSATMNGHQPGHERHVS